MDESGGPLVFAGDLEDPWVAAIADALPASALRLACPEELPEAWPPLVQPARVLVLHRSVLTETDAERLGRLRTPVDGRARGPRVILCAGPYARYHHFLRWASLVDVVLPEATAPEVVARHVAPGRPRMEPRAGRSSVTVVSRNHELRQTLAETCAEAGFTVAAGSDWSDVPPGGTAVWDVPCLEDSWGDDLSREAPGRRILALLGFADRPSVALARERGAAACLDLPCDVADLAFVLDRLAERPRNRPADPAHVLPPPPVRFRVVRPEAAQAGVMADPTSRD
jgi:hypothetical protein